MNKKSFVRGAAILGAAGLIVKVIGAFYRIPLTNLIGESGMGVYQIAYPIYSYLLVLSSAGLPTAISKLVSERIARGRFWEAHKVFRTAMVILLCIGLATSLAMWFGSGWIAVLLGDSLAALAIKYIAPALLFVSIISAFRGYFQGMQSMGPTAFSQLAEQAGKLAAGLYLAKHMFEAHLKYGHEQAIAYGAAGAMLGVTISELAALFALVIMYYARKKDLEKPLKAPERVLERAGRIAKSLAKIAVPVTMGASIIPLVGLIDAALINNRLVATGFSQEQARSLYGLLTGVVATLVNMPSVLTVALCVSLVPSIAGSRAAGDMLAVRQKSTTALKLMMLVGMPCAAGLCVLARPVVAMLYPALSADSLVLAASMLQAMSAGVFFLSLVQTTTGILQGLGKVNTPVLNMVIGAGVKIAVSFALIGIRSVNIYGAVIGTVCFYAVTGVLNTIVCIRSSGVSIKPVDFIVKPLFSTVLMVFATNTAYNMLKALSVTVSALVSVAVGVVVYSAAAVLSGAITGEDAEFFPGGGRLRSIVHRLGIK